MRTIVVMVLGLGALTMGCGGSDSDAGATSTGTGATTTTGATGSGGAGQGGTGSGGATGGAGQGGTAAGGAGQGGATTGGAGQGALVINEISAAGADWVEIANASASTIDLGDYAVCDSDANGGCKVAEAVRFPKGTLLATKERAILVGNKDADAGVGPGTDCIQGGPSTCFYATWKVSAKNGESLFVLDANDQVIGEAKYPANAVPDGQTWGRLPDFTGDFAANAPTPGAPNAAP
jgi:hypothetical protein